MNTLIFTERFTRWLRGLKDRRAYGLIVQKLDNARYGNFGDAKPVGGGVSEMRIHCGPGYRLYYARKEDVVYVFLAGGDKSSQRRDIEAALSAWQELSKE